MRRRTSCTAAANKCPLLLTLCCMCRWRVLAESRPASAPPRLANSNWAISCGRREGHEPTVTSDQKQLLPVTKLAALRVHMILRENKAILFDAAVAHSACVYNVYTILYVVAIIVQTGSACAHEPSAWGGLCREQVPVARLLASGLQVAQSCRRCILALLVQAHGRVRSTFSMQ